MALENTSNRNDHRSDGGQFADHHEVARQACALLRADADFGADDKPAPQRPNAPKPDEEKKNPLPEKGQLMRQAQDLVRELAYPYWIQTLPNSKLGNRPSEEQLKEIERQRQIERNENIKKFAEENAKPFSEMMRKGEFAQLSEKLSAPLESGWGALSPSRGGFDPKITADRIEALNKALESGGKTERISLEGPDAGTAKNLPYGYQPSMADYKLTVKDGTKVLYSEPLSKPFDMPVKNLSPVEVSFLANYIAKPTPLSRTDSVTSFSSSEVAWARYCSIEKLPPREWQSDRGAKHPLMACFLRDQNMVGNQFDSKRAIEKIDALNVELREQGSELRLGLKTVIEDLTKERFALPPTNGARYTETRYYLTLDQGDKQLDKLNLYVEKTVKAKVTEK